MSYADHTHVWNAYHFVTSTTLTAEELDYFCERATNIIDAYASRRYAVPFATNPTAAPPFLRDLCADLAMIDVIDRCPTTPEFVKRRIEDAREFLRMLRDGEVVLPGIEAETDFGQIRTSTRQYVPTFGVRPSLTEHVDSDRGTAEADARTGGWGRWWEP